MHLRSCHNSKVRPSNAADTTVAPMTIPDLTYTVRENGVPNSVAPPKVSQRRAQPCAAVRRRIDTASSRPMIVLMC